MALEHNQETRDFISQFTEPTDSLRDDIIRGGLSKNQKMLAIIAGLLGIGSAALAYYLREKEYTGTEPDRNNPRNRTIGNNWEIAWEKINEKFKGKKDTIEKLAKIKENFIQKTRYKLESYFDNMETDILFTEYFYLFIKKFEKFEGSDLKILEDILVSDNHKTKINEMEERLNEVIDPTKGGAHQFYYYFLIVIIIILVILVIFLILKIPIILSS